MPRVMGSDALLVEPKSGVPYLDRKELMRGALAAGMEGFSCKLTGTGANLDSPPLPFDPAVVIVNNETDQSTHIWTVGMGDAKMMSIKAAAAWVAAGGITPGSKKFTLGNNADLNTAADVLHCVAFGFRDRDGSQ